MSESFGMWLTRLFVSSQPKENLSSMTKLQLEAKGREIGIELDRRYSKAKLVEQLERKMQEV
tara:strand:+ start:148 stop:333 length:186 start_codon:yes stop_codon:yes gene_type:complete